MSLLMGGRAVQPGSAGRGDVGRKLLAPLEQERVFASLKEDPRCQATRDESMSRAMSMLVGGQVNLVVPEAFGGRVEVQSQLKQERMWGELLQLQAKCWSASGLCWAC